MQSKPKYGERYICKRTNFPRRCRIQKYESWIRSIFFSSIDFVFCLCSVFLPSTFRYSNDRMKFIGFIHTDQKCLHKILKVLSGESEKVTKRCWKSVWKIPKKKSNKNSIDLHSWCSISFQHWNLDGSHLGLRLYFVNVYMEEMSI